MANKRIDGTMSNHAVGQRHGRWKGGRMLDKDGYILIRLYGQQAIDRRKHYEREHRLVVESLIGRKLGKREAVHHIDQNRQNNIPENLELTTWSYHRKHHDREMGRDQHGRFPNPIQHIPPKRDEHGRYMPGKVKGE